MRFYGGNAGRKECISFSGATWLVKYPSQLFSYAPSPVSEYVGSHVFEMVGISVHQTLLGLRNGMLVVACRDFTDDLAKGEAFYDFHDVKNNTAGLDVLPDGSASSGNSTYLSDVLKQVYEAPFVSTVSGVRERFWDMFVVDAVIGNSDRNNTNWGFIFDTERNTARLAPVFDNGNCLFNKRAADADLDALSDESAMRSLALDAPVSIYLRDDGKRIHPFSYIRTSRDIDCLAAVDRFVSAFSLDRFEDLLSSLPDETRGSVVMPQEKREFLSEIVRIRDEEGLRPFAGWSHDVPELDGTSYRRDEDAR
jgi:hypothetical protein